jgi:hypothetical protein
MSGRIPYRGRWIRWRSVHHFPIEVDKSASSTHEREHLSTHRSHLFTDPGSALNLFLVGSSGYQSIGKALHCQLPNGRSDSQRFYPICPEVLITEEGLDDRGYTGCIET